MFAFLSSDVTFAVRSFLMHVLSQLSDDWWCRYVVPSLSFQQQRSVERNNITSLDGLDLAALLRILDKNWYELSAKCNLSHEARNWIRELQQIRNRWAHNSGNAASNEDLYRDFDTLQRFLSAISADSMLIEQVRRLKQEALSSIVSTTTAEISVPPAPTQPETVTEFALGAVVRLKSTPETTGAIIQVNFGAPESRYVVFVNGRPQQYYASQLELVSVENIPEEVSLETFHACLTALHLHHPGLLNLYSLHAARIDYIPYQFKPVMKLIRSDRPRLLIADEVGVGKTIEAGLILRELQARRDLNSVLIICPKPLVTEHKWRNEMKRFDEEFEHLDGPTLRHCLNETDLEGVWPGKHNKVILPFSLFNEELLHGAPSHRGHRKRKGLFELDPSPKFDLIIVDEAHHLRNPSNFLYQGVKYFCDNAEAVVFLTATPIQLGLADLYVQLNLLRPDLVIDPPTFEQMAAPNVFINQAIALARSNAEEWQGQAKTCLGSAAATSWGKAVLQDHPEFQAIFDSLDEKLLDPEQRVTFIRKAEGLHSFASIINRTRRRDIGTYTTRTPETVEVPFSPAQQQLHDDLLAMQARILCQIHGNKNLLFMMTTIRRQAASCLYGLAPLINDILTRRLSELDLAEIDDTFEGEIGGAVSLEDKILEIMERAANLDPHDPKLEALLKITRDKLLLQNNKILLFSSFRHTLAYLEKHLQNSGLRIGYIHGGTPDEERREKRYRFSLPPHDAEAIDVLLSSEVGCEGLDYQFCDCLVNYDLPWNPMKIEQRIGRIDRYGQQSESVAIYNLITPGTVDADIYHRCLWRIGVFHSALGGSEEILGKLANEIHDVAENLSLTPEQREEKLAVLADNEIRIIQEQAALEERQAELFGLRLPQQVKDAEIAQTESFWLTPEALLRLVRIYLERSCGEDKEYLLGEKQLKTLRLSKDGREILLADYKRLSRKSSPLYRDWEKWLKGNEQHLAVTFDARTAKESREKVTFITPVHPLALQAARALARDQRISVSFKVEDATIPPGKYLFSIYQWQMRGVREDVIYQPICADETLSTRFTELMSRGEPIDIPLPDMATFEELDARHQAIWSAARLEHQSNNGAMVEFRRESLRTSHAARLEVLNGWLMNATDAKIRRMRQSEIENAEEDFKRRMAELDVAEQQVDIHAQPVAVGVMLLEKQQ